MKKLLLSYNVRISSLILIMIILLSTIGCSSLNNAIRKDDTEKVISLLEKGKVDINKLDEYGETPLISATRMGDVNTVKLLIEAGADVNLRGNETVEPTFYGYSYGAAHSALKIAAIHGDRKKDSELYTGISATKKEYIDIATMLIKAGADINAVSSDGYPVLVGVNDADIVKLLLDYGADVNAKGSIGNTDLILASGTKARKYLLYASGNTALILASGGGNFKTVKLLLDSGANVNAVNDSGKTALQQARNIEVVKLLVEAGANTESIFLGYYRNVEIMEFLLKNGAKVDYKDTYLEWTSLWRLCNAGGDVYDYAKLLLDYGADVNVKDTGGYTPLYWAMKRNDRKLVQLLIDYGAEYKVIITY